MKGIDFEKYVCRLLEHQGYKAKLTGGSGDFGVDIIAQRGDLKYAIQVKRHTSKVNRRAISDAVAGKGHYGCNAALVVTNSYFTKDAITFAQSTKCELVNRDTLAKWILEFQKNE
jgi:restriction system protein